MRYDFLRGHQFLNWLRMPKKTKFKTKDLISGFWFLALGLFLSILSATNLSVWVDAGPQAGFFPLLIGIIMAGLGIIVIFQSYSITTHEKDEVLRKEKKNYANIFKLLAYLVLIGLYAILLERIGFLLTSTLFLALVLKIIEKKKWRITVLVTIVAVIISYLLFRFFLGVPLPEGLAPW